VTEFATYPSLRGQVAFVSGGATGLGAEFVAQLAAQGVQVGFVDIQDDAGRDGAPRIVVQPYYALGDAAEQAVDHTLRDYYGDDGYTDEIVARAATDAGTVRENVEAFTEAGCDELIFFPCDPDPEQVDLLADALR